MFGVFFFFSSRRRHTRCGRDWSSDVCSSDLKPGRQPHWHAIVAGRDHLGWQRWPDDKIGRWVLRRRRGGSYNTEAIGVADDAAPADGVSILSFDQARSKAVE